MLETDRLSIEIGKKTLLKNINIQIENGEMYVLTGKQGSGKSVLLKTLCGIFPPGRGDIRLDGVSYLRKRRQLIKKTGYLPQKIGVYENLTVFEYMDFFASACGMEKKERKEKISELLRFAQLDGTEEQLLEKMTGELKRKICLATILLRSPKLLLLDEPCVGLEPDGRQEIQRMVKILLDNGMMILTASKNTAGFSDLCSKIAVLENGELSQYTGTEKLLTNSGSLKPLIIQVVSGMDQAICILKRHPMIENIAINGSTISAVFHGSEKEEGALLSSLVSSGTELSAYYREIERN